MEISAFCGNIHIPWILSAFFVYIRISWKYPRSVDIIHILWKYPRSVDIILILCMYPHFVEIIRISWNYPHSVDIIRISSVLYLTFYLSSESDWCITYFPVCNLMCFYVTYTFRSFFFVSGYKLNPNPIRIYVPPFTT